VENNVRKWRAVEAILEDCAPECRMSEKIEETLRRLAAGMSKAIADFIEH
jgi:hypothetical protein